MKKKTRKKLEILERRIKKLEKTRQRIKVVGFDYLYNHHDDNDYDDDE